MKKIPKLLILASILIIQQELSYSYEYNAGGASVTYTQDENGAKEQTQQQILSQEQEIFKTNLKALQLQIAEYRNRVEQSATYGGGYKEVARDVENYKKELEELNKKVGNNLVSIETIGDRIKKRFGTDNINYTTAELVAEQLKSQQQSLQRLYIRLNQINKTIDQDERLYDGSAFASKLENANNPIKALGLIAETTGGIQRAIHSLNQILIEKSLKEELDKLYALETMRKSEYEKVKHNAEVEYYANSLKTNQESFIKNYLTKEEYKQGEEREKQRKEETKEIQKAVALRLQESGLHDFSEFSGTKSDDSLSEAVDKYTNDKQEAQDLGKNTQLFKNGKLSEKGVSELSKLFDNLGDLAKGGVFDIGFGGGSEGGLLGTLGGLVKNPQQVLKAIGNKIKNEIKKSIIQAKNEGIRFLNSKINEIKREIVNGNKGIINQLNNTVTSSLNKAIDTPISQMKGAISDLQRQARDKGVDIDVSDLTNKISDFNVSNLASDTINKVTDTYSEQINNTIDYATTPLLDGLNSILDNGITKLFNNL